MRCMVCGRVSAQRRCDACAGLAPAPAVRSGAAPARRTVEVPTRAVARAVAAPRATARQGGNLDGTVGSHPTVAYGTGVGAPVLGALFWLLLVVWVVTTPQFIEFLIVVAIIGLLISWLVQRAGAGRAVATVGVLALAAGRNRGGAQQGLPTVSFRINDASNAATPVVHLRGHDATGIALGDAVSVRGVRGVNGVHALSIVNRTTGLVLRRHGVVRAVLFGCGDVVLALLLLARFA